MGRKIEKLDYVHDDYEKEFSCFYFGVGACSIYSINKLGNVTGIYIHGNMELTETMCIPKYIYHLKFLKELSMIYCFIYVIPEELGQLSYLKRIYLNSNYIETIPKSLGLLQNLVYIDLCWNPISNVKSNYCFVNKNLVIKIGK